MLKPKLRNILLFWLCKYVAFYILMMFKNNNYTFLQVNEIKNGEDLFLYLWLFMFLPVVCMLNFATPMYYSFKVKSLVYFFLITVALIIVEYFVYVYFTSDKHIDMNGINNGIISVLFFIFFFFRHFRNLTHQNSN